MYNDHERINMNKMLLALPALALMVILAGCGEREAKKAPKPKKAAVIKKAPAMKAAPSRAMKYVR